jgi:hypothetical protein
MSRPKTDLFDWVFEPEADETEPRCESVFRNRWRCVAPLGHVLMHWCPDGPGIPWTWYNSAPIIYRRP